MHGNHFERHFLLSSWHLFLFFPNLLKIYLSKVLCFWRKVAPCIFSAQSLGEIECMPCFRCGSLLSKSQSKCCLLVTEIGSGRTWVPIQTSERNRFPRASIAATVYETLTSLSVFLGIYDAWNCCKHFAEITRRTWNSQRATRSACAYSDQREEERGYEKKVPGDLIWGGRSNLIVTLQLPRSITSLLFKLFWI